MTDTKPHAQERIEQLAKDITTPWRARWSGHTHIDALRDLRARIVQAFTLATAAAYLDAAQQLESRRKLLGDSTGALYEIECLLRSRTPAEALAALERKVNEARNESSNIGLLIVGGQLKQIPNQNFLHADRYDTDTEHKIHLWDDNGNSYDVQVPREKFLHSPRAVLEREKAKARLEEFDYIKGNRPIDPTYFDMHHRAELQQLAEGK